MNTVDTTLSLGLLHSQRRHVKSPRVNVLDWLKAYGHVFQLPDLFKLPCFRASERGRREWWVIQVPNVS